MKKTSFNIAIDGLSGVGKSSIGYQVAKWLKFIFIDSGLFYRYIANRFYLDNTIQFNEIYYNKDEMISKQSYYLQEIEFANLLLQENLQNENRGYVVVGRNTTTKILPNARVKLVLEADFETRVYRKAKQLNAKEFDAIGKVFSDLLKHDMDSFDLVLVAKKVVTVINTSDLSIEQVVAKILSCVLWIKFGDNNILYLIIFILFVFVYNLHAHFSEKIQSN
ncbi:cytidylate kinase [Gigaspora margarita]|uniref:(d)CMP kinase n=1 Tax=Gigaspora margarita TaxID=4874 RepID=A0A8H3WZE2_GIGMA|nr:cytidylate kinase [Gigaspora margarita]